MRIDPGREILDVWAATARTALRDGRWTWGGRHGSNSISDAEQVLCILLPATTLPRFFLDRPDETHEGMLDALQLMGDAIEIPRLLTDVLTDYFERYRDETVTPIFSAGDYLHAADPGGGPTDAQLSLDVVASFAVSVTLCLATIGFVRVLRYSTRREELRERLARLDQFASARLSAALIGLLRSFTVRVFDADSPSGVALCRLIGAGLPSRQVVDRLRADLRETRAGMHEMFIGSGEVVGLDAPDRLFECGWSWGIVPDAPQVETTDPVGVQRAGVAVEDPYLLFTLDAMDGIEQLFSERTRILGLLNEEQQRLARALQLRWEITRTYWTVLATFAVDGSWALQDIPWRTTDGEESDQFSLLITALVMKGYRGREDADWAPLHGVLTELADRGRLTRRPLADDPAVGLHWPGVPVVLHGADRVGGPALYWSADQYAPLLGRCAARSIGMLRDIQTQQDLSAMTDRVWRHLAARRRTDGAGVGLWDEPAGAFPGRGLPCHRLPSWSGTLMVVQFLVAVANRTERPPPTSDRLAALAVDLLAEAEGALREERMNYAIDQDRRLGALLDATTAKVELARRLLGDRPGSAAAVAVEALRELTDIYQTDRDGPT
jgi:hypothetical protein